MPDDQQGKSGRAGEGGEGGAGGAGGDPSGVGGAGGRGGEGGGARRPGREERRSTRVTDWFVGCAAVAALIVSIVNYVQQDNLRDAQAEALAVQRANEDVAGYLAYIASQPSTIERIRLHLEATTGTSLPDLPPVPTGG